MVYAEIIFCFAEDLPTEMKSQTDIETGLVVVKVKLEKGLPEYEIEEVKGTPSYYIRQLAKMEKIEMERIFSKFND